MSAYSFKPRFVPLIRSGQKRQTIRGVRKDGRVPKVGESLHLYTGLRTKSCQRIFAEPVWCTSVQLVEIDASGIVSINGVPLDQNEREQLAINDGFRSWEDMLSFWDGRLPFKGNIIHWEI
jgi:hypothetical protein